MTLDDLRITAAIIIIIFVLITAMSAGLVHCLEPSPQTNCEVISLYIKHKNPNIGRDLRDRIAYLVVHHSALADVPHEIIAGIMCVESCYNPIAIGPKGEIGLMQIYTMKCNNVELQKELLYGIEYNIAAGVCIFLDKLKASDGDLFEAIKRYNGTGKAADEFRNKVCRVVLDIMQFRVASRDVLMTFGMAYDG